jgi:hypothetical protein
VNTFAIANPTEEHYWTKRFLVERNVMEEGVGVLMKKSERTELAELRRLPAGRLWHRIMLQESRLYGKVYECSGQVCLSWWNIFVVWAIGLFGLTTVPRNAGRQTQEVGYGTLASLQRSAPFIDVQHTP